MKINDFFFNFVEQKDKIKLFISNENYKKMLVISKDDIKIYNQQEKTKNETKPI